ncbi:MAG: 4Fe-4S binding protein [Syntrophaceae bacterium]|nr:4Fe-4S binding protein [Syntrophaceae bacterium]
MKTQWARYCSLAFFLALMTWFGYQHQLLGGGPAGYPPVDALCPLGGLEGIYSYLRDGTWLRRLAPSALVLFAAVTCMTLLLGRTFCGWVCPMGAITEFVSRLARRLGFVSRSLPAKLDLLLRGLKYVILVLVLLLTWYTGTLVFRDYDPWKAWMHLGSGFGEGTSAIIVLGLVILAEFFIERCWCRYLCPLGAALGLLQIPALTKIRRNPDLCISCKRCDKACITGLKPMQTLTVNNADCIACGKCVALCPKQGALRFTFFRMPVSVLQVGLAGLIVFLAVWGGARLGGAWSTFPRQGAMAASSPADKIFGWMTLEQAADITGLTLRQLREIGGVVESAPTTLPLKQMPGLDDEVFREKIHAYFAAKPTDSRLNPAEIRGSMTLVQIGAMYGVAIPELLEKAGWPADLAEDERLRELAQQHGKEVEDIRRAVKELAP